MDNLVSGQAPSRLPSADTADHDDARLGGIAAARDRQGRELFGDGDAGFPGDDQHPRPPAESDAAPLAPLVDGFTVDLVTGAFGQAPRQLAHADGVDDVAVVHTRSVRRFIGLVNDSLSDDSLSVVRHDVGMARKQSDKPLDPYKVECGRRLTAARLALGFASRRAFAEATRVQEDRLEKWEHVINMVNQAYVLQLKKDYGVTFEWVYAGETNRLPADVFTKLMSVLDQSSCSESSARTDTG